MIPVKVNKNYLIYMCCRRFIKEIKGNTLGLKFNGSNSDCTSFQLDYPHGH